jgi:hypothetical protein
MAELVLSVFEALGTISSSKLEEDLILKSSAWIRSCDGTASSHRRKV